MGEPEKREVISIRGIDRNLYSRVLLLARETGKTVGEILNEAMDTYLTLKENLKGSMATLIDKLEQLGVEFKEGFKSAAKHEISDLDELVVTKKDLEYLKNNKVSFKRIRRLIFSKDVDPETFERYIDTIAFCGEVAAPPQLPKLLILSRCRHVNRILTATEEYLELTGLYGQE